MAQHDPGGSNARLLKSMAELRAQRKAASASRGPVSDKIADLYMQRPGQTPESSSSARFVVDLTDSPEDDHTRFASGAATDDLALDGDLRHGHRRAGGGGLGGTKGVIGKGQAAHDVDALIGNLTDGLRSVSLGSKAVSRDGPASTSTSAQHEKENVLADDLINKINSLNLTVGRAPSFKDTNAVQGNTFAVDLKKGEVPPKKPVVAERQDSEAIRLVHGNEVYCLPATIAGALYAHQREGIHWLWGLHCKKMGGVLGDDMGLGKTMQMAAFLAGLFLSKLIRRVMIVAPKTLLAHWARELSSVGLGKKVKDYSGTSLTARNAELNHVLKLGGVLLTTYDMVRVNWKALMGASSTRGSYDDEITWDYMVLDEGHLIKNPNTERAKSLREISSTHRFILSGTPIQNNLREMWALFDFCCPDLLGDWKEFKEKYENPIQHGNDKMATDRVKRIGSAAAEKLRQRIAPVFLRRMKSEVFPNSSGTSSTRLPLKNDLIVWLRLSKCQQQLYRAFLSSEAVRSALEGTHNPLAAITVLKKICDHPLLLTKRATKDITEGMENILGSQDCAAAEAMARALADLADLDEVARNKDEISSCKIDFISALLDDLVGNGHRTLIFSQTRKMLDIIQEEITGKGYTFRRIDGTMKASDREQNVQEFQVDKRIVVFLLTSQVGGLGLTLTGADRVIIVDPNWNPSVDNQSVDRAYRIGQTRNVVVFRLISCSTIEEKVYRKQVFKGGLMKVATEKKEAFRYFSQKDLREIFSVPDCGFKVSLTQQQLHKEHATQYSLNEDFRLHMKFLDRLPMFAGISHHDLLFSKEDVALPQVESKIIVPRKDVEQEHVSEEARQAWYKVCHLRGNINRLAKTLEDQAMVDKLPDKGLNIVRKVKELTLELSAAEARAAALKKISPPAEKDASLQSPQVQ